MADNPFAQPHAPAAPSINRAAVAAAEPEVISGANWFWWIGGLSIVNSIMIHSDSDRSFAIGLGFTLVADIAFKDFKVIALCLDAVALAVILGLGFFARKGHFWAFVTGIVLYTLDALIYIPLQGWMSIAFHGLALFYMIRGAKSLRAALKAATESPPVAAPPPVPSA